MKIIVYHVGALAIHPCVAASPFYLVMTVTGTMPDASGFQAGRMTRVGSLSNNEREMGE